MTDEQLSALLRLKRHEQPPAAYFDKLLRDLHRRQRAELLHRPLWRIALERVQTFFGEHSMGHVSYAGSMAALLVIGVGAIGLMTPGVERKSDPAPPAARQLLSLQNSAPRPTLETPPVAPPMLISQPGLESVALQPRYVIDSRPASYEPSSSFNF